MTDPVWMAVEGRIWAIREELVPALAHMSLKELFSERLHAGWDNLPETQAEPKPMKGEVSVVPLRGILMPPMGGIFGMLFGDPVGDFKRGLRNALDDDDVKQIVLDIDSPGGQVDGIPELAAQVFAAKKKKPITAMVNSLAASAAYWIASQTSEIAITPSGEAGSIGVYTIHRDVSAATEAAGIKHTVVSAGKYKTETNPYEPLDSKALGHLQEGVNDFYDLFTKDVARGRGVTADVIKNGYGQGRALTAKRAVKAGLADRVATLDEVLADVQAGRRPAKRKAEDTVEFEADSAAREEVEFEYTAEEKDRLFTMAALFGHDHQEEAANAG